MVFKHLGVQLKPAFLTGKAPVKGAILRGQRLSAVCVNQMNVVSFRIPYTGQRAETAQYRRCCVQGFLDGSAFTHLSRACQKNVLHGRCSFL
jgi:hypothetical protein